MTNYKADYFTDGYAEEMKSLKNLLGCEAHNELMKNAFLMIFEYPGGSGETGNGTHQEIAEFGG